MAIKPSVYRLPQRRFSRVSPAGLLQQGTLFFTAMAIALLSYCITAPATQPPSYSDLITAQQKGDLSRKIDFIKMLGNDRFSEELAEHALIKVERAELEAEGFSPAMIDGIAPLPPPNWRGLPTTGSPKTLTLLIDFSDHRAPAAPSVSVITQNHGCPVN